MWNQRKKRRLPKLEPGRGVFGKEAVKARQCVVFATVLAAACWALAAPAAEELEPSAPIEVTYYDFGPFELEPKPRDPWAILARFDSAPETVGCSSDVVLVMTNANNRQTYNLRWAYEDSDLVAVAVAGVSSFGAAEEERGTFETELKIENLIRGDLAGRSIVYRRDEHLSTSLDPEGEKRPNHDTSLAPGTRVLVFLYSVEETGQRGEVPRFESRPRDSGIMTLESSALAATVERLEALKKLQRGGGAAEPDPRELAEWLVATAEEPATRGGSVEELSRAVEEFEDLAEVQGIQGENAAAVFLGLADEMRAIGGELASEELAFVGAALTEDHRVRLLNALSATDRFDLVDMELFGLVRAWGQAQALAWLVTRLEAEPSEESESFDLGRLLALASYLDDFEELEALFSEISERSHAIDELWPDDGLPGHCERRTALQAELALELRARLIEALTREL